MLKKTVAIFIPGYYGSTLQDEKSGRLIWGDTNEVLFGRKSLALEIAGLPIPGAIKLRPHSLINDKKILGGLIREDAYDKTISFLKKLGVDAVMPLAWDWRREPILALKALDELVLEAKKLYPDYKLILLSHSFGSLVTSYYLRYGALDYDENFSDKETWKGLKVFDKIVLSACPYRGLMAMFRNMQYGIKFGLNHNMQSALAFSTFESSYYLLPPPGLDQVFNENGELESLDLYNPKTWVTHKMGLFSDKCRLPHESPSIDEVRYKFVEENLKRSLNFHSMMTKPIKNFPEENKPILYLSGHGQKTVHHGLWLKKPNVFLYYPKHFKKWKVKQKPSIIYGDGDATVPDFSLKLPSFLKDLNTTEISDSKPHLETLQSDESQKLISAFLLS